MVACLCDPSRVGWRKVGTRQKILRIHWEARVAIWWALGSMKDCSKKMAETHHNFWLLHIQAYMITHMCTQARGAAHREYRNANTFPFLHQRVPDNAAYQFHFPLLSVTHAIQFAPDCKMPRLWLFVAHLVMRGSNALSADRMWVPVSLLLTHDASV